MKNAKSINYLKLNFDTKMKLSTALLLLFLIRISATTYSQKTRISIEVDNITIEKVLLDEIQNRTEFKFFYENNLEDLSKKISLKVSNKRIDKILKTLFENTNIQYEVLNKQIVLTKKSVINKERESHQDDFGTTPQASVSGTVSDKNGAPLPGVNIVEKGTTNGVVTDFDGNYTISVPNPEAILVFSYIGFATREEVVAGRSQLDMVLEESQTSLEEIVIVGYGSQRKADLTGSVVRIDPEKVEDLPNANLVQAIQGLVPGININTNPGGNGQGTVGADPQIRVRGENSLSAGNNPLLVVDQIIYNGSITDFNANDIESIDILKDASATAVYGARAANGVLLITTKKGQIGKPKFNFSTYTGFQVADKFIDVLDGPGYEQKIADFNEAVPGSAVELTPEEIANRDAGNQVDWIDESTRTARISNYNLNVSGASEKTNYYVSGTFFDQEGIVKGDQFQRLTLNLNLKNQLTNWWSLGVRSTFIRSDRSGQEANLDQAYRQSPYGDLFDEGGPGGLARFPFGDPLGSNPLLSSLVVNEDESTSLRGVFSSELSIPFIEGLKWTVNYGANLRNRVQNTFTLPGLTNAADTQNGIAEKEDRKDFDWTLDNIINYNRTFGEKHNLDLTLLFSRELRFLDETEARSNNFVSQELGFNNLGLGAVQFSGSNREEQNTLSQMGRLNYGFNSKYSMTYTIRRDGFSAFSPNEKFGIFQAGAFAWTLSNEKFLENSGFFQYLKLRLSIGQNGNQAIPRFSSFSTISTDNQFLFGNDGSSLITFNFDSLGNPNLSWETTTSFNIGLDFSLTANNSISGALDVYQSKTEDLLQERRIPAISGFNSIFTNIGEIQTRGVDLSLRTINMDGPNFRWESGLVLSFNKNEIVSLGGVDTDGDGREDDDIANGWFIGEPIDAVFGFQTDGIYQLEDETSGTIPDGFRPGDFRLVDTDGDGDIDPDDRVVLGRSLPDYTLSFSNTFSYKGFSLYVLLNSAFGKDYVGDNFETRSVNRLGFSSFTERFNVQDVPYWTPDNPTNLFPRIDYVPVFDHPILESRDFLRIQDISLSYAFGERILEKIGFENIRVYASLKNVATFTDWSGYDPQSGTTIQNLPFLSSYTFGMNFSF